MNRYPQPLVSMGMPAYNHEDYIEEAILSVIEQTYENIEFIIINDGSSDSTHEKIKLLEDKCKERFVNFIYINRKNNKGISYTSNQILALSTGKYYMGTASDDTQSRESVSVFVDFMEDNIGLNCCFSGYCDINENNNIIRKVIPNKKVITFNDVIFGNYSTSFLSYIKKIDFLKEIGKHNENTIMEDWEAALRISAREDIHFIDNTLYNHRYHDSNTCTQHQKMQNERFRILGFYKNHELYEKAYFIWKLRYLQVNEKVKEEFKTYISHLSIFSKDRGHKYLIYGNGTFGKIIYQVLQNSIIGFVDKDTSDYDYSYDYIIISVLGREKEIVRHLQDTFNIQKDKIIII